MFSQRSVARVLRKQSSLNFWRKNEVSLTVCRQVREVIAYIRNLESGAFGYKTEIWLFGTHSYVLSLNRRRNKDVCFVSLKILKTVLFILRLEWYIPLNEIHASSTYIFSIKKPLIMLIIYFKSNNEIPIKYILYRKKFSKIKNHKSK